MDLPDVPIEAIGEVPAALGGLIHQASYLLQVTGREDALKVAGVSVE